MPTVQEEIQIKLGMNPRDVQSATDAIMAGQKKASIDYVDFWTSALNKRESAEKATAQRIRDETLTIEREKNTASIAMARARVAEELAIQKAAAIESGEIQAAGNVSGGFGSAAGQFGGMVAGGYAFSKAGKILGKVGEDGKLIQAAGTAEKGLAELGESAHGNSTAFREIFVLIREGLRGNFSRMVGSASILAGALGALGAVVTGLVVTLPLTLLVGFKAWQTHKAREAAVQSGKDLDKRSDEVAEELRKQIEELNRAGSITDKQAEQYNRTLKNPSYENVVGIQNAINPLLKNGTAKEQLEASEKRKEMARLDEEHQKKMFEYYHADADIHTRLLSDEIQRHNIMEDMAGLQKDTVAYKQKQLELDDANRAIQQDQNELAKQKAETEKTAAEKRAEADTQASNLYRRIGQNEREMAQQETAYPTIEDLAGRRFTKRLSRAYGSRGRYDLGRGDGWLAQTAQDYERAKYQQMYDRTYGNTESAEGDRQRMIADRKWLIDSGAASPELQLEKMRENTDAMEAHLQRLVTGGAVISTKITGDDN